MRWDVGCPHEVTFGKYPMLYLFYAPVVVKVGQQPLVVWHKPAADWDGTATFVWQHQGVEGVAWCGAARLTDFII